MDDGIYIPVSDRTLRKLDKLVLIFATAGEGYSEDRILSMGLDNLLACMREGDGYANENFPSDALPPEALSSLNALGDSRSALGASNSEMPAG